MSGSERSSINPAAATSLTLPPIQVILMADTPMAEAPSVDPAPASTSHYQTATASDDRVDQSQQQQLQQRPASEQAPPITDMPPATPFPRELPPREPTSRQPTPRQHDHTTPPDRLPPHYSSYPVTPDSLPQAPHAGMAAPAPPRAHTGSSADRIPHLSTHSTAYASAPEPPQPGTAQMPQQGMSAAGWLVPPPANSASRITFEGMFYRSCSSPCIRRVIPSSSFLLLLEKRMKRVRKVRRRRRRRRRRRITQWKPRI